MFAFGSLPKNAYGSLVPALSLVKKVSKRDITGRSPPNVVISPATLCGTIQSFCAPFPLAQPAELAGS
jgi:hypothetical protein